MAYCTRLAAACWVCVCASAFVSAVGAERAPLREIATQEVAALNADLQPDAMTMDVGVLLPSNFDPKFDRVTVEGLLEGVRNAKEIYAAASVQINVLWIKTGRIEPDHLAVMANRQPATPDSEHVGLYDNLWRAREKLSEPAEALFSSLVEPHPDNHRTIYVVALQEVFFSYYAKSKSGEFQFRVSPTSGFSFPSYYFGRGIPRRLRGVITVCNLSRPEKKRKTIAHEIGHKTINVSHEYKEIEPSFEVNAEGGLMVYGSGVDIPSGEEGRWHRERLLLSPFLYHRDDAGEKIWNPDYEEYGHYSDPIYGDFVVE